MPDQAIPNLVWVLLWDRPDPVEGASCVKTLGCPLAQVMRYAFNSSSACISFEGQGKQISPAFDCAGDERRSLPQPRAQTCPPLRMGNRDRCKASFCNRVFHTTSMFPLRIRYRPSPQSRRDRGPGISSLRRPASVDGNAAACAKRAVLHRAASSPGHQKIAVAA